MYAIDYTKITTTKLRASTKAFSTIKNIFSTIEWLKNSFFSNH